MSCSSPPTTSTIASVVMATPWCTHPTSIAWPRAVFASTAPIASTLSAIRRTRIFNNNTPPLTYLGNVIFLPEHFRNHGYFTARVGKIAHGRYEDAVTWDISENSGVEEDPINDT
jgi:hypothetical protein